MTGTSNLASRRIFLKSGLGACAAGVIISPVSAQAASVPYYKAVFDERFADARVFGAGAAQRGIPAAAVRGDITRLFFDDLDLRWKQGTVHLAGFTTRASLFCLDLLARDRGMRVSHCVTEPELEDALGILDAARPCRNMATLWPSSEQSVLVCWIIGPAVRGSVRSAAS